ncbi:MAG: phosphoserine phosphatase SerB [Desulfobulbaceae bacterium S3730MH12]|nr:MAG: phosphoserine phosphatase SerB [Desulfobulbaceae bacterium S5133MH15]OEU54342.1 MAG: phosphoserine phosphatase SerB [Desulfobulbaceae bacterium S3730MH12]OEU83576.1 MAG: phosphoserine phosphatase SerB [Desulfobulbaceae bacterium C00003063]
MNEIVLINITGRDRKGLDSKFISILAEYDVSVLDIGQAVIHEHISLGILAEIPVKENFAALYKDVLYAGHKMDLSIEIKPVEGDQYEKWVEARGKERRIITLLGKKLTADQIARVATVIFENNLNIDSITRLSGRISIINPQAKLRASIQMIVSGKPNNVKDMRAKFMQISRETGIDISFHVENIYSGNRKLVAFDMDSTLIHAEVINELAKLAGVGEQVAAITESAMRGEIDFKESFRKRVALLKGLKVSELENLTLALPLSEGAALVCRTLKGLGYKLAILSGGFTFVGDHLKEKLGFDYVYANELDVLNGKVTGEVCGEIIDGEKKAELLKEIAERENITLAQTIAVGDGANDLPMISCAGLGVAFHAKPIVRERAGNAISTVGLDGLLYLLGIHEREINQDMVGES